MSSSRNQSFHLLKCANSSFWWHRADASRCAAARLGIPASAQKRTRGCTVVPQGQAGAQVRSVASAVSSNLRVFSFCRDTQQRRRVEGGAAEKEALLNRHSLHALRRNLASLSQAALISPSWSAVIHSLLLPLQNKDKSST